MDAIRALLSDVKVFVLSAYSGNRCTMARAVRFVQCEVQFGNLSDELGGPFFDDQWGEANEKGDIRNGRKTTMLVG